MLVAALADIVLFGRLTIDFARPVSAPCWPWRWPSCSTICSTRANAARCCRARRPSCKTVAGAAGSLAEQCRRHQCAAQPERGALQGPGGRAGRRHLPPRRLQPPDLWQRRLLQAVRPRSRARHRLSLRAGTASAKAARRCSAASRPGTGPRTAPATTSMCRPPQAIAGSPGKIIAVRDSHGRLVEVQSVGRDITERKALEDALTEARDNAEAGQPRQVRLPGHHEP